MLDFSWLLVFTLSPAPLMVCPRLNREALTMDSAPAAADCCSLSSVRMTREWLEVRFAAAYTPAPPSVLTGLAKGSTTVDLLLERKRA